MSKPVSSKEIGSGDAISCERCEACCCRLEVMLMGEDDIPLDLTSEDRWGGWVMRRLDDGWCIAVDRDTMKCTIYEIRPGVCRDYQAGDSDCMVERAKHPVHGETTQAKTLWPLRWRSA